ncbi:hypothetical protein HMPREF9193_01368 [Treponema lecithinolyticum ATCC 700332]|uniref:Uncharacterized protein n=1 Tax=Treponema lecithinolyticum ATCC 700332 TaxID=1321815 RepID=A0ABN0NY42_TRELE|nr:hypothetical protein HMPREF9193_01368 [Treponema lecithinolyticum ATCC 700332]
MYVKGALYAIFMLNLMFFLSDIYYKEKRAEKPCTKKCIKTLKST